MTVHRSQQLVVLGLLVLAGALAGCGEEEGRSAQRGMGRGRAKPVAVATAPKEGTSERSEAGKEQASEDAAAYEHEESGQFRDPFHSYLEEFQRKAEGPVDEDSPRSATEMYDVGQFSLVGVITGTPVPKAMLADPTGFAHVVRPGDRIGKQGGRIAAIYANEVVVTTSNPRLGDEESRLMLYAEGQGGMAQYGLAIIDSGAAEKKAAGPDEERFLQQLDLQQILRSSAAARQQASARATAASGTPEARRSPGRGPQDLPAIPVVPVLVKPPPSSGGAAATPGNDRR